MMQSLWNIRFAGLGLALVAIMLMTFSQFAEAKRLGGGKSFGYQKQVAPKSFNNQKDNKSSQTTPAGQNGTAAGTAGAGAAAAGTAAKSGASKWLGPLAGLAAGGLLAAMIFGDGFENLQILDILIFALIAFLLFKLFMSRKRAQQAQEPAYQGYQQRAPDNVAQREMPQESPAPQVRQTHKDQPAYNPNEGGSIFGADLGESPTQNAQPVSQAPEWFDADGFIDGSKSHFLALQSAWDQVDLSALESYCTPELYKALEAELEGVQAGENHTKVEDLQSEIAAMSVENDYFYVSVRYSGFMDEDGQGAHAFTEIWHIRRLAEGEGNWALAGIQQNH